MILKKIKILQAIVPLIVITVLYPLNSFAIMVEDPTEWSKTAMVYKELVSQLHEAQAQYAKLQQQYQEMKMLRLDSEGHYGYGNLWNTKEDLLQREWSAPTWQSALQGLSGSNPLRYKQLLQSYQASHPTLSQQQFLKGASSDKAREYHQEIQTNQAAAVNSSYAFNNSEKDLKRIYSISSNIEKTNTIKAATDLNGRLLTEIAYMQVQQIKMQTILNQEIAEQNARQIETSTEAAKFNTLPKP